MRGLAFIVALTVSTLGCGPDGTDTPSPGPVAYLFPSGTNQPALAIDIERGEVIDTPHFPWMGLEGPAVADVDELGDAFYTTAPRPSGWTAWLPPWARRGLYRMGIYVGSASVGVIYRLRPGESEAIGIGTFELTTGGFFRPVVFAPRRNTFYLSSPTQLDFSGEPRPFLFVGVDAHAMRITDTLVVATEAYPSTATLESDSVLTTAHLQPYETAASPDGRWLATIASYSSGRYWVSGRGRGGAAFVSADFGGMPEARVVLVFDLDADSVAFEHAVGISGEPTFTSDGRALYVVSHDRSAPTAVVQRSADQHLLRLDLPTLHLDTVLTLPLRSRGGLYGQMTPLPDRPTVVVRELDGRGGVRLREFDAAGAEVGGAGFPFPPGPLAASGTTLYALEAPRRFGPAAPDRVSVIHRVDTSTWRWVRSDTLAVAVEPFVAFHIIDR